MNTTIQACVKDQPSFLNLPPEIRLEIYRLLHVNSRTIGDCRDYRHRKLGQHFDWEQFSMDWYGPGTTCWDRYDPQKPSCKYSSDPGSSTCSLSGQLLATCQSIYRESIEVLYGENAFGIHIYIRVGLSFGCDEIEVESNFFEGFKIHELDLPWPARKLHLRGTETDRLSRLGYPFAVDKIRRLRLVLDLDTPATPASQREYSALKYALYTVCQRIRSLKLQHLNVDLHSRFPMTRFCVLDSL